MLKHIKGLEMKKHNEKPLAAQEREAYASPAYLKALEDDALRAAELVAIKAQLEAARITIDIWRTESATERASYG